MEQACLKNGHVFKSLEEAYDLMKKSLDEGKDYIPDIPEGAIL